MTGKVWISVIVMCILLWTVYINRSIIGLWSINQAVLATTDATIEEDISYGAESWQRLDLYAQTQPAPVVVFIYGGSWSSGEKSDYAFVADAFFRKGYTVVIPDYAKYPAETYPTFVEDVAAAVAWTINNITLDKQPLYLAAHSAGAHSAALVATDSHYLQTHNLTPQAIDAFVGLAGPYNFTPEDPQYIKTFGRENFTEMKANTHVSGDEPPTLLLHGKKDELVDARNASSYQQALKQHDVKVEVVFYAQLDHVDMVLQLHPWFNQQNPILQTIHQFFTQAV